MFINLLTLYLFIYTEAGVQLKYIDSQILEYSINDFVATDTPILFWYESLIVQFSQKYRLEKVMEEAFVKVTNYKNIQIKFDKNLTNWA